MAKAPKAKAPADKHAVPPRLQRYWREIERYKKATEKWYERADKIDKEFRNAKSDEKQDKSKRRFAMLWANTETSKPAVYAKAPTVVCARRFKDQDPIGRTAAEILERTSNSTFDLYKYNSRLQLIRDDLLLPGRGTGWMRYEAKFEPVLDPETGEPPVDPMTGEPALDPETGQAPERLAGEKVCLDHVNLKDFGHNVCRKWEEVWLIWRKVYWDRHEAREKLGKEKASELKYTFKPAHDDNETRSSTMGGEKESEHDLQACVIEVWDKRAKKMALISKDFDQFLDDGPPPVDFHDFFPTPEPCYATKSSETLIPTPDYSYYRHQAEQINELTAQIGAMTKWLVVKGFIPGGPSSEGSDAITSAIQRSGEQIFATVESRAGFVDKGGVSKLIEWFPVEKVAAALTAAVEARKVLVGDVYELTGASDIMRGQSDPNETLGAQELKAQTGARRIKNKKDEFARYCRDIAQLACEIMAEHFQPETLAAMSGFQYLPEGIPPEMQQAQAQGMAAGQGMPSNIFDDKVMQRLRDDRVRSYSIDIETDSTVMADEQFEKQSAMEFLTGLGSYLTAGEKLIQAGPIAAPMAPVFAEGLKFYVRKFRAGRSMEETIERAADQVVQMAQQAAQTAQQQGPPPDPNMVKAEAAKAQGEAKLQIEAQKAQGEHQLKAQDQQHKHQLEQEAQQNQIAKDQHAALMAQRGMQADNENAAAERAAQQLSGDADRQAQAQEGEAGRQHEAQQADAERALTAGNAEADREVAREGQELKAAGGARPAGAKGAGAAARASPAPDAALEEVRADVDALAKGQAQIAEMLGMIMDQLTSPRKPVRKNGKLVGVRTKAGVIPIKGDDEDDDDDAAGVA